MPREVNLAIRLMLLPLGSWCSFLG